jgi:hypothetical protein
MERLPDRCTCPTPYRKKITNWLNLVKREAQLIMEIHENNYKPRVEFILYNGNSIVEKITDNYQPVKINDYNYEMVIEIRPQTKINKLLAILYDTKNKPLYRHKYETLVVPPNSIKFYWRIGVGFHPETTISPSDPEAMPLGVRQKHARKRNRKRRDGCDPA